MTSYSDNTGNLDLKFSYCSSLPNIKYSALIELAYSLWLFSNWSLYFDNLSFVRLLLGTGSSLKSEGESKSSSGISMYIEKIA